MQNILPKAEYIFFPSPQVNYTEIDPMIGQKTNLSKFKRIQILQSVFSDHNEVK